MVSEHLKVINKQGFHMRPASTFVQAMAKFKCDVTIIYNGKNIDGKSIMNVMSACMKCGAAIEVQCFGEDENEALAAAVALVQSGLGDEI